ncbi:hypothetical protein AVEN_210142-1 [Araneus ventricosus]|uniref:Uncharacterized protein n=1 Tax=Araneus ventricosus TaxID=182803 RepID=A0A4Y2Q992_ARAVE|nr:hypothetical protein AVEN_210142-1 [Araneus ventricosus]
MRFDTTIQNFYDLSPPQPTPGFATGRGDKETTKRVMLTPLIRTASRKKNCSKRKHAGSGVCSQGHQCGVEPIPTNYSKARPIKSLNQNDCSILLVFRL